MIRDPRDVVLSGMHYHMRASEKWLHEPRDSFNGKTYQEVLLSLDQDQAFWFELNHAGWRVIRQMMRWDYSNPRFYEASYEALMEDRNATIFGEILDFAGIDKSDKDECIRAFKKNSLFNHKDNNRSVHVRSGQVAQWRYTYTGQYAEWFEEVVGDSLRVLGYEHNSDWKLNLPHG